MKAKIRNFIQSQTASGIVLMMATVLALVSANSFMAVSYREAMTASVTFFINDILMALFFLLVGLEIKRELVIGELSSRSRALQPLLAALGGVILPMIFFLVLNHDNPQTIHGWAIPCATDIAFALGVLSLLGKRVPPSLTILLAAIAIIDDLIAVLVIAFFYTADLHLVYLGVAAVGTLGLFALNRLRSAHVSLYLVAGAVVWTGFLKAGVHPTLAGVVTAMALPVTVTGSKKPPLARLEHFLHPWVAFIIVPLFVFANAGLDMRGLTLADLGQPLTLGIILGLVLGKPLGIMGGLYLGHVTGLAKKPNVFPWHRYYGIAVLCGIGFTMSLFIGELGFDDPTHMTHVKLGVLFASTFMAVAGWALCRVTMPRVQKNSSLT